MEQNTHEENIRKIAELVKEIRIAMLTTVEDDGTLHSRPMANQKTPFDGTFWFFTAVDSPKVQEIQNEHHVNVSFADSDKHHYVSVSGKARVIHDREKAKELWTPFHLAFFPEGIEDPKLALLQVTADRAEYWDSPSSTVVQLFGLAKAMVTGKAYAGEAGEHRKVEL